MSRTKISVFYIIKLKKLCLYAYNLLRKQKNCKKNFFAIFTDKFLHFATELFSAKYFDINVHFLEIFAKKF
jgi:hypothetical protein